MNILTERLQDEYHESQKLSPDYKGDRFSIFYLQAVESFYQFLSMLALFWFDLIPGFGSSANTSDWSTALQDNFACFFTPAPGSDCAQAAGYGTLFLISYIISYVSPFCL
jgi:hypothetical protein